MYETNLKGVRWDPERKKWRTDIRIAGRKKYLGRFDSKIIAAKKYDEFAKLSFGDFAYLNYV